MSALVVARGKERGAYGGETGDINDGQCCGHTRGGLVEVAQPIKAFVRDRNASFLASRVRVLKHCRHRVAYLRVNRRVWVVGSLSEIFGLP